MANNILIQRLEHIRKILLEGYHSGKELSAATKGFERELFIANVLSSIIAPPFRVGSGDLIDSIGNSTGQLDVVIEYGNSISFPVLQKDHPRLYLAEGVCAIIEIKSDIAKQWGEVLRSHAKICPIVAKRGPGMSVGSRPKYKTIPHFGVGYMGWSDEEVIKQHVIESEMSGLLILDSRIYCNQYGECFNGNYALFSFLQELHAIFASMVAFKTDYSIYTK